MRSEFASLPWVGIDMAAGDDRTVFWLYELSEMGCVTPCRASGALLREIELWRLAQAPLRFSDVSLPDGSSR